MRLSSRPAGRGRRAGALVGLGILLLWVSAPEAGLTSKTYQFNRGGLLEIGVDTGDGLRIDRIRFDFPAPVGDRLLRTSGLVRAEVALSNTSSESRKPGIALALFDAEGRLVGVASGGSQIGGLKPGRLRVYNLVFEGVNAEAFKATTFQISVEAR